MANFEDSYYFKFGEPGGVNYDPGCSDAQLNEDYRGRTVAQNDVYFNRSYLNVDQYNYLASRINSIRKVRPLVFEDHYRMYPYRSGEMLVPKDLYTMEVAVDYIGDGGGGAGSLGFGTTSQDFWSADPGDYYDNRWEAGLSGPKGPERGNYQLWGRSFREAKEHFLRDNPSMDENDITLWAEIDLNTAGNNNSVNQDDWPKEGGMKRETAGNELCPSWESSTDEACVPYDIWMDNGSRCGKFVEWQEGDPYSKNATTKEYTEKFGYWKNDSCCKRHVDSNGEETTDCEWKHRDLSQTTANGVIWDAARFSAASDVKLYHIAAVTHVTGWQMGNLRGGLMNEGDSMAWPPTDYIGEYMLNTSAGDGNGNTSNSFIRNPFREGSMGHGRYPRDNVPRGQAQSAIERHYHPWWLNIVNKLNAAVDAGYGGTKIPVKDQDDYPKVGDKNWVDLMEESGVALSDSIQTHTYGVTVTTAGPELTNPNASLGTVTSPYPNLKKKEGTVIESPRQKNYGKPKDPGDNNSSWGTFNTQQSIHLVKSSWELKSSNYEIIDPMAYDYGLEYEALTDADGKEIHVTAPLWMADYGAHRLPVRGDDGTNPQSAHWQACEYHCFKWDELGFKYYDDCLESCIDEKKLKSTLYRFLDTSSYLFEPANFFNGAGGLGGYLYGNAHRKIWHPDFAKAEDMIQKRGQAATSMEAFGLFGPAAGWSYNHKRVFGEGTCPDKPIHECIHVGGGERGGGGLPGVGEVTEHWDYMHVGRITDYRIFARHGKYAAQPYGPSLWTAGANSLRKWNGKTAGLLKRSHMLIHPWHFGYDEDQHGLLGEFEGFPGEEEFYGPLPDPADNYLAIKRQSSVGYRKGVQPNLYNSFKMPVYRTKAGRFGAGNKTHWGMGDIVNIDQTPVEGYPVPWDPNLDEDPAGGGNTIQFDPYAKKVYWVSAPDVQTRAKELGFHFEFRRLTVPYKMKEVNFSHSVDNMYRESGNYHYLDHPWFAEHEEDWLSAGDAFVGAKNSLAYCQKASNAGTEEGYYEPQAGGDWGTYSRLGCGLRDAGGELLDTTAPVDPNSSDIQPIPKADHADLILQSAGRDDYSITYGTMKLWPWILNEAGSHSKANDIFPDTAVGKEFEEFRVQLGKPNKSHMSWWGNYTSHSRIYKLGSLNSLDGSAPFSSNDASPCPFYGKTLSATDSFKSDGSNELNLWQLTLERMTNEDLKDRQDYCKLGFHEEVWAGTEHTHGANPTTKVDYYKPKHGCNLTALWWAEYDRRFGESSPSSHRSDLRTHLWGKDAPDAADEESRNYPFNVGAGASIKKELAERMASVSIAETCSAKSQGNNVCSHVLDQTPPDHENAHAFLIERGNSFDGSFEFDAKGYIPHVKKSYIFTTSQNAAETEWVRPIGHSTVRHISKGFSNYDLHTTDYVKKQKTFSCEIYKKNAWGEKWTRDSSCDPHRFENVRLDNDSIQWSGNMIYDYTSLPRNVLLEKDAMPSFWGFDVTSKRIWTGPDNKHEKGVVYDNTRLLTDNPFSWTVAAKKAGGLAGKKTRDWTTKLPIVTEAVSHKTANAISDNSHEGRYQKVGDPEAEGAKEGTDYIEVAGVPLPMGELFNGKAAGPDESVTLAGVWFDPINFYGGSESDPGFADMRRGGGFAFIGGKTRNSDKTEINNYGTTISPYDVGSEAPYTESHGARNCQHVFGGFAACSPIGPVESGTDGSPAYEACPDGAADRTEIPDCVINNYFQPVYGDGGYNQFGPPNPGRTCTAWATELVECITEGQKTGCFFGSIDTETPADRPTSHHRIGCYGAYGLGDTTVNVPVPITAQLINGYSVKPRVSVVTNHYGQEQTVVIGDNMFYMTVAHQPGESALDVNGKQWCEDNEGLGKEDVEGGLNYRGNIYPFAAGRLTEEAEGLGPRPLPCNPIGWDEEAPGQFEIGTTSWGAMNDAGEFINRTQSFNSYPWHAADSVRMGSNSSFYNINWYDMIDHYDQTAILNVSADADYKKEMLKLIDNRNPDALLYQDYTDFYASSQYNKLFRYEEKDFVYGAQTDMDGKAISSLVPWFNHKPNPGGGVEGVGQSKYKLSTFLELQDEHFGGREMHWEYDEGKNPMSSTAFRFYAGTPDQAAYNTTILKTQSMPMADTDFITKSLAGSFGGSLVSLAIATDGSDYAGVGLCPTCNGTDYWIGNSAATSAVNFYIENMIDLSPEAESLGGVEAVSWGAPDMTPSDPNPVSVPS